MKFRSGMITTVAILCAARNSVYKTMVGVEVYDMARDVRTFSGGMPIVAHPPCRAWSAFCAHQAKPAEGEKELGLLCVELLKRNGGILEHPAHSRLYDATDSPKPGELSRHGLWSIAVKQSWWGCDLTKSTWLLFGGLTRDQIDVPLRLSASTGDRRRWQVKSKHQRSATTHAFAEWLVCAARKAMA